MAQVMAERPGIESSVDDFGVLVGWSHTPFNRGIDLRVQSAAQASAAAGQIDSRHYLMTRNQALILAKYLLDVTGQELPARKRPGLLRRLFSPRPSAGE